MEKEFIVLLCVLATIVAIFIGVLAYKHFKKKTDNKNKQIVIENSKLYAKLLAVNDKYHFNTPLNDRLFFDKQNSNAVNSSWTDFILLKIEEDIGFYIDYLDKIKINNTMWRSYNAEYHSINNYATKRDISGLKISLKTFNKIERELLVNNILSKPTTGFSVYACRTVNGANIPLRIFSQEKFNKLIDQAIEQIVIKNSQLYAKILFVNQKFNFDTSITDKIVIEEQCSSKISFDNFDWIKHIYMQINANETFYSDYINKIKVNKDLWEQYKLEYASINNFATEEDVRDLKIPVNVYNTVEKSLLMKNVLTPTVNFTVDFNISYTSPLGRNFYSAEKTFSQEEFEQLIVQAFEAKKIEELERQQREQEKQRQRTERAKERNLMAQIERKNKELQKREETLNQKEEEFKSATQGHIYSNEHVNENIEHRMDDPNESIWVKLKRLKQRFDNGEITYEQYEQHRKKLLYGG